MKRAAEFNPVILQPTKKIKSCDVLLSPDGYLTIRKPIDIKLFLPVLKIAELDTTDVFYPDVLDSCARYVPKLSGITDNFLNELSSFKHAQTKKMVQVFEFTRSKLMYGKYEADNPGHLYVALQVFGGWWAGVVRELFLKCVRNKCRELKTELDLKFKVNTPDCKADELVLGILSFICKCFGCAARTPLLPHLPFSGPPSPVSAFVDYLVGMHPTLSLYRDELYYKIRDWHVPAYARDEKGEFRAIWESFNMVDRIKCIMEHQLKKVRTS